MRSTDDESPDPTPGRAYGARVAERLRACTLAGPLPEADSFGEAGSKECGSLVRIELRLRAGVVEEARYQAHGCPATLASASQVCLSVTGRPFLEAAGVSQAAICRDLGLVQAKEYTAEVALDALHLALSAALANLEGPVSPEELDPYGVMVGMSGGVDSAVAALLLRDKGFHVVGVTLTLWNDPGVDEERSCCSSANVARARRVAHSLGIPHVTLDAGAAFYRDVVEYFVAEYAAGRTPNPCAKCNSRVRVGALVSTAQRLGLRRVATGHYARLTGSPLRLARGVDRAKDQSYVLAEVSPTLLEHMMFPLGELRKPEVRGLAAGAMLEGHSAPESQEICFVPDDDHRRFLRDRLGDLPGEIVDTEGRVLGQHRGTYNFTVGQRKGLRLAAAEPRYVVSLDASERRVVVGSGLEIGVKEVLATGLVWHRPPTEGPLTLQVRSSGQALAIAGLQVDADRLTVILAEPAPAVSPGQTAVLYEDDNVVAAGTISTTARGAEAHGQPQEKPVIDPVV